MKPTITIKELTIEDFETKEGFFATLSNVSETQPLSLAQAQLILKKINQQNGHIFIAYQGKSIIGTVTLLIEQKFIHKGGKVGHIEDVAARKGYEGQGIASALLKHAIAFGQKQGCYKIILDCDEQLIPFYKRLGFFKKEVQMRYNCSPKEKDGGDAGI